MARLKGLDVSVFTVGGVTLVAELQDCTFESNVGDEDGSAINEIDEDPEPVSRTRQITGTAMVEDVAALMEKCEGSNPVVAFTFNTGGMLYAGNALISRVSHSTKRKALQTTAFTLKVKGAPTLTAPGGGG